MIENQIGLIIMDGADEIGNMVTRWLKSDGFDIENNPVICHKCHRFTSGEGKAELLDSVRGRDIFIISDVTNYTCTYEIRGHKNCKSPDDHYMDIKRVVSACGGKCKRITVIMPYLYCGRQDKRFGRESLDAALVLRELVNMGVSDVITFDAHNSCVENAIPFNGFDNIDPIYQMIKAVVKSKRFNIKKTVMVSSDEGGLKSNSEYAQWLKLELGSFYKLRNLQNVDNGNNTIVSHKYMGGPVNGLNILVADDVLATGSTLISVAKHMKKLGAESTSFIVTAPLFTNGYDKFDEAFENGSINCVFGGNLVYRSPELLNKKWYIDVDLSKYLAYIIYSIHNDMSINSLLNPNKKIQQFLNDHHA